MSVYSSLVQANVAQMLSAHLQESDPTIFDIIQKVRAITYSLIKLCDS